MRIFRHIPDWMIYGFIVLSLYFMARNVEDDVPEPPPPPDLGEALPGESPRDPRLFIDVPGPSSGTGTAFAIDNEGTWLTARHVVDSCDRVGINLGGGRILDVKTTVSPKNDTAILTADWKRKPLAPDLLTERKIGERAFFLGFPQGRPGEAAGRLIGQYRMVARGRYNTDEPVLAWTEISRTSGLWGSLGGMSGGPVLDKDGEVIGVVSAESIRRGRVYTVSPKNLRPLITKSEDADAQPISVNNYGRQADRLRRERRIAQVLCWVDW